MFTARVSSAVIASAIVLAGCGGPVVPPAEQYASMTGIVRDAATGLPVVGAIVSVSVVASQPTGADGRYTVYPIPNGPFTSVSVTAPRYQSYLDSTGGMLTPGQTVNRVITLFHL